jgi:hypothetical protein
MLKTVQRFRVKAACLGGERNKFQIKLSGYVTDGADPTSHIGMKIFITSVKVAQKIQR